MTNSHSLCEQFASILKGKGTMNNGVCKVSLKRNFHAAVQGKSSTAVTPVDVLFESLDSNGNALNLAEIAILQEEIPAFMHAVVGQGIIVSALHNHWIYTSPLVMYIHLQSVEPPLDFARKVAYAFGFLKSPPK